MCIRDRCRGVLGFVWGRKEYFVQKELSGEPPKALSVFRGLFWAAAAAAVAGLLCGTCFLAWQQAAPLQKLEGEKLTIRAQTLDYPEEQYHRYYYKLKVTTLGEEGALAPVEPFTLRLSATMPLAAQPYDWVECDAVSYTHLDVYKRQTLLLSGWRRAAGCTGSGNLSLTITTAPWPTINTQFEREIPWISHTAWNN